MDEDSQNLRILAPSVGAATAWPPLYFVLFGASVVQAMFSFEESADSNLPLVFEHFHIVMAAHLFTMLLHLGLLVIYVLLALRTPQLGKNERLLWGVLLFVGGPISMAIYFFKYLWSDTSSSELQTAG